MRTAIIAAVAAAAAAYAGPLVPPVGPVTSTDKPLAEVEPRIAISGPTVINQSGSYYLTNNIAVNSGTAITVTSGRDVVIDLNGFSIVGANAASVGIQANAASGFANLTLKNGVIRNFTSHAVNVGDNVILRASDVAVYESFRGFVASTGHFERCDARQINGSGFLVNNGSFDHCTAIDIQSSGFTVSTSGAFRMCEARDNGGAGFSGTTQCVAIACKAVNNDGDGFSFIAQSVVEACQSSSNGGSGFRLGAGSAADDCIASNNGFNGFTTEFGGTIQNCTARSNTNHGFVIGPGSTVTHSAATANRNDGFQLRNDAKIFNSTADDNGTDNTLAAGIRGTSDVTIDSCHVTDNPNGIVAGTGALVIRCSAAGNDTNYVMTGADHGPIINVTAVNGAFAATNPFSNLSY